MSNDEPRICIVGAGGLSTRRIYPNLAAAGGRLVGVCDLDREKATRNARRFGGIPYTDMPSMLEAEKPDAVIVCIGPDAHARLAAEILRAGIPVYTEKPPAPTAARALEVARIARATGKLCVTAFKKRYTAAAERAKEWLGKFPEEDRLSISVDYCSDSYANDSPDRTMLFDFSVHILDLVRHLFGDPSEVFAFSRGHDAYAVSLRFPGGAVGSLNLNNGRSFGIPTEEIEMTVQGGNFMTIHNSSCWKISEDRRCVEWREPPTFTSAGDSGRDTGHLSELEDFVSAVREGRPDSRSSIADSYRTLVLYEAIRDAALAGQVVRPIYEAV